MKKGSFQPAETEPLRGDLDPRLEPLRQTCLNKPAVLEEFPFGPQAMVYKVVGKMYALIAWEENPVRITLKCDPDRAIDLREKHDGIGPGYYMNKKHWITVTLGGDVSESLVYELIDHSYDLVVQSLPAHRRPV